MLIQWRGEGLKRIDGHKEGMAREQEWEPDSLDYGGSERDLIVLYKKYEADEVGYKFSPHTTSPMA